jgi:hypothetical protein
MPNTPVTTGESMSKAKKTQVLIPIERYCPPELVSRYATDLIIQRTGSEFILSFFETIPPMVLGTPEEQQDKLKKLASVRSECIARVIVSDDRFPQFVQAMQENLERWQSTLENESEDD